MKNNNKHFFIISVIIVISTLLGGCLFNPYQAVKVYDLPYPKKQIKLDIKAEEFANNSSATFHMQSRQKDGIVNIYSYDRWVISPGELISRGLNATFYSDGQIEKYVYGEIQNFEVDEQSMNFIFNGSFKFNDSNNYYNFYIPIKLKNLTPQSISCAAGEAVNKLANIIAEKHKDLQK